jgi:hypothetical protein
MRTLVPWRFGAAFALTVMAGYAVCTAIWLLFTEPSIAFVNALFHGLDFRRLHVGGTFAFSSWLFALAVLSAWAFLMGALFAQVHDWLTPERPSS